MQSATGQMASRPDEGRDSAMVTKSAETAQGPGTGSFEAGRAPRVADHVRTVSRRHPFPYARTGPAEQAATVPTTHTAGSGDS